MIWGHRLVIETARRSAGPPLDPDVADAAPKLIAKDNPGGV
jgi:hypothetical protein